MDSGNVPGSMKIRPEIIVCETVSEVDDIPPVDFRMLPPELRRELATDSPTTISCMMTAS